MYSSTTAQEAVKLIKSGDRVFIHSVVCAPHVLINAMMDRSDDLKDIKVIHIHTEGEAPYVKPEYDGNFHLDSFFVGHNVREATQAGRADYIPTFLSETPIMFREGHIPLDVALVQISTPDRHGYCS